MTKTGTVVTSDMARIIYGATVTPPPLADEQTPKNDLQTITKARLDAARKDLWDCRDRENEASIAYHAAVEATTVAIEREGRAFAAWCAACRVT